MSARDYAKEAAEALESREMPGGVNKVPQPARAQALALLAIHGELRRIADAVERQPVPFAVPGGTGYMTVTQTAGTGAEAPAPPDWDLIERALDMSKPWASREDALAEVRRARGTP